MGGIIRDSGAAVRAQRGGARMLVFFVPVSSPRAIVSRLGTLRLLLVIHCLALAATADARSADDPTAVPAPAAGRPRIGLVLSGGGARGAAHVGVLKVLEELNVPVDAIAGTSMGAVVGGLYASGLSARDIEKIMTSLNWQTAFHDRPPREDLTLRRKQEDENFLVTFPLGVRGHKVVLPKGLIEGQGLSQLLRRLTLPVARVSNFDDLPTPFRAVATDLESGEGVVLGSGDLTSAMRASMSAPGIFAPVERQGRVLVDGGIADNIPVDVARAMGVDLVIVVDVGAPLAQRAKLTDVTAISNQMLAILLRRNGEQQLATLEPHDILITPPLGDASSFDFGAVARYISAGEAAARAAADRLVPLAVSAGQMQQYRDRREAQRLPPPVIRFVQADGGSQAYSQSLDRLFRDMSGKPLDPDAVARRVTALYGLGGLDTLDYRVVGHDDYYGLALDARPSSMGPNYLRFGLSLQDDFEGHATYDAAVRFVMSDITRSAGEWVTDLQGGTTSLVSTELFLPLAEFSGWFVMPHASDEARELYWYNGQSLEAEYRVHTFQYGSDFGYQFGNWGEARVGAQRQQGHYVLAVGDPTDPDLPEQSFTPFNLINYFARFTYDRLDDINFPHSGQQATLQWSANRDATGIGQYSNQVTASYLGAYSFGRDTLSFSASGGATLEANVTDLNLLFPLGGFLNLSGLRADSLLGANYGIARLMFYRQIGRGGPGYFDVPTYVGASLEAGNVWQSRTEASFGNTQKDASVFLGLDTLLGPLYVAFGFDEHGNQAFYLFLGRTF